MLRDDDKIVGALSEQELVQVEDIIRTSTDLLEDEGDFIEEDEDTFPEAMMT